MMKYDNDELIVKLQKKLYQTKVKKMIHIFEKP